MGQYLYRARQAQPELETMEGVKGLFGIGERVRDVISVIEQDASALQMLRLYGSTCIHTFMYHIQGDTNDVRLLITGRNVTDHHARMLAQHIGKCTNLTEVDFSSIDLHMYLRRASHHVRTFLQTI